MILNNIKKGGDYIKLFKSTSKYLYFNIINDLILKVTKDTFNIKIYKNNKSLKKLQNNKLNSLLEIREFISLISERNINYNMFQEGDVFIVDIPKDIKNYIPNILIGNRPVIVFGNERINNSSRKVHVLPLSTKIKKEYYKSHIMLKDEVLNNVDNLCSIENLIPLDKELLTNGKYIGRLSSNNLNIIKNSFINYFIS